METNQTNIEIETEPLQAATPVNAPDEIMIGANVDRNSEPVRMLYRFLNDLKYISLFADNTDSQYGPPSQG